MLQLYRSKTEHVELIMKMIRQMYSFNLCRNVLFAHWYLKNLRN